MKLLLITYSYTPDLTPRAFRWAAVVDTLVAMGHDVHVLCASGAGANADKASGASVHRVPDMLFNASARVSAGGGQPAARGGPLRAALVGAARWLRRTFLWPDYACGWLLPATRAARRLVRQHGYDWIISTSHPFSGHLVALWSRREAPSTRWLVDISDPYSALKESPPYNRRLYGGLSVFAERRVVEQADAITVTTEPTATLYAHDFPRTRGAISVIPPLLSLPAAPPPGRDAGDGVLRLVFVGTLYRRLRNPAFLLACAAEVMDAVPGRELQVHFYGSVNDCAEDLAAVPERLRAGVFVHGLVPRAQVQQAMADADVLVNIGNDAEAQLASKVVEYMAAARPILNIVSVRQDASVEALADHPAVLTLQRTDTGPSREAVDALARFLRALPHVPQAYAERVRERYSSASIASQYLAVLSAPIPQAGGTG